MCWGCLGGEPVAGLAAPAEHCNTAAEKMTDEGNQHFHNGGKQQHMLHAWNPPLDFYFKLQQRSAAFKSLGFKTRLAWALWDSIHQKEISEMDTEVSKLL